MERPTGTVTFMFTDIEASTRILARHPRAYPTIVTIQRGIVVEEAARHGGVFVGHEGDSCFLAFADATSAIAAAAAAQARLWACEWPDHTSPRIRFGLHTGEAEVSGGDYYGLAVHTAARVASAAHGGQVLLSHTTRRAGLPAGLAVHNLGSHRLRDIEDPIGLYQLVGPALPSEFPPIRTASAVGALRTPSTSLVGRDAETAEIIQLIDQFRLVTLLGPGGIGKTRLALNVGMRAGPAFGEGVWFADLTTTDDSEAVADMIAEAVGVCCSGDTDSISVVAERLAHADGLVIIDNFEHVMAAAPVVSRLLEATTRLRVLVTSRERLRLNGERVYTVEPLSAEPPGAAVQLFLERARDVMPDFDPTPADLEVISRICTRLEGLPLAIELAAARMRVLQPADMAERLGRGVIGLSGGARDLHARQQAMRTTVEWSHQLLRPQEQDLLARLAIFSAPARLDGVEMIAASTTEDVYDLLTGLVDKSLVHQKVDALGETRFGMLVPVREFVLERLAQHPDALSIHARHAAYFTDWTERAARELLRAEPERWFRRIDTEFGDIAQAFEWSLHHDQIQAVRLLGALGFYFHRSGLVHTAWRWSELVAHIDVPPLVLAARLVATGYAHFGLRQLPEARAAWEQAIDAARSTGQRVVEAWATVSLGATFIGYPEHHDEALQRVRHGVALAQATGSMVLVGLGHNIIGELCRVHGDDDGAEAAYLMSITVARQIEDHQREGIMYGNRVYIATRRGDLDLAIDYARTAIAIHRRHGHRNQLPWVSIALAGVLAQQGRIEEAAILLAAAEESARKMQYEELPGDVVENRQIRTLIRHEAGTRLAGWSERGRAMTLDDALDLAIGVSEPAAPVPA